MKGMVSPTLSQLKFGSFLKRFAHSPQREKQRLFFEEKAIENNKNKLMKNKKRKIICQVITMRRN